MEEIITQFVVLKPKKSGYWNSFVISSDLVKKQIGSHANDKHDSRTIKN